MQVKLKKECLCKVIRGQNVETGDIYYKVFSKRLQYHPFSCSIVDVEHHEFNFDNFDFDFEHEKVCKICQFVTSDIHRVRKQTVVKLVRAINLDTDDIYHFVFQDNKLLYLLIVEDKDFMNYIDTSIKWIPEYQEVYNICEYVSVAE